MSGARVIRKKCLVVSEKAQFREAPVSAGLVRAWNIRGFRADWGDPSGLLAFALMGCECEDRPLFPSDEPQFPDLYPVRVPRPPRLAVRDGLGETRNPAEEVGGSV